MAAEIQVTHHSVWFHEEIRVYFQQAQPRDKRKGTILLIHGFPQTSYQFRHVIKPLASAGYHVIAPDYRGHGFSSKPLLDENGFTKRRIAKDLYDLVVEEMSIKEKIHVVGHDIGGMIAYAFVAQFPDSVASVTWGECPLPGTSAYEKAKHARSHWHFDFQGHRPEMAAALVAGKEKMYLKDFYDRLTQNQGAFTPEVVDYYAMQYSQPDALRCAFFTYRAFQKDAQDNRQWLEEKGKLSIRNIVLSGDGSTAVEGAEDMAKEIFDDVQIGVVEDSGHYLAEENPEGFVREVLRFIEAE